MRKLVNFVASYLEIEQLDVISGNNLATELACSDWIWWIWGQPLIHAAPVLPATLCHSPPRMLLYPRGVLGEGGNPFFVRLYVPPLANEQRITKAVVAC